MTAPVVFPAAVNAADAAEQAPNLYAALREEVPAATKLTIVPYVGSRALLALGCTGHGEAPFPLDASPDAALRTAGIGGVEMPASDAFREASGAAAVLGAFRRSGRGGAGAPEVERTAKDQSEIGFARAVKRLQECVVDRPGLSELAGAILDLLVREGRSVMEEVALFDGQGSDPLTQTRGALMLDLLDHDLSLAP